eukprot:11553722-Karenia_brevis.AAC.1
MCAGGAKGIAVVNDVNDADGCAGGGSALVDIGQGTQAASVGRCAGGAKGMADVIEADDDDGCEVVWQ